MRTQKLLESLEGDCVERLRWLVLKEFGVLPGSKRAGALSDRDCIRCAAHMVLDRRERTRERGFEGAVNTGFEQRRFEALGGERK